ncbi:c-type cytochrome [Pseudomonas sp.]|uniref:c-type cytochrome n=1 Tax=Pseudomonas sp. TaxID=306 RepID=UPI0028A7D3CC|nr:c-type cytochrome [Pseudomonas sp.]
MRTLLLLLIGLLAFDAHAGDEEAMARFNYLMGDATLRQQAYEAGEERIVLCGHCHGKDGNSKRDYIPNLAAQNPLYLFRSFEKFANGERNHFVMSSLAKSLSLEERVDIAIYFSQQKVVPLPVIGDAAQRQHGKELFDNICHACHGAQGEGQEKAPRLAGQSAEYVRLALTRYHDKDPRRALSVMYSVAAGLTPTDIESVAAYVQQLAP